MTIGHCAPPSVTQGVVVFNSSEFLALYPGFTAQAAALPGNFNLATLLLANTCGSAVCDAPTRQQLLYLLTCHLTALLNGVGTTPGSGLVGRISGATQGTVLVDTDLGLAASSSAYVASLSQTQWGLQFLAMTVQYRSFRYAAPPQINYGPYGYFGFGGCLPFNNGGWGGGRC
jgi:hypothetical protein